MRRKFTRKGPIWSVRFQTSRRRYSITGAGTNEFRWSKYKSWN